MSIPVYKAEIDLGLSDLVRASSKVVFARTARASKEIPSQSPPVVVKASQLNDLLYLTDVLVSTGWNKNDEVFAPEEVWAARATPVNKPFNYQHVQHDIIGHTLACWPALPDGQVISETTEKIPDQFDLVTSDVIYLFWEDAGLQERMASIANEILDGKWFVSMECLFSNFDYGVVAPDGTQGVIARGEETAFLTKHLRAYGGTGEYEGYRIGRLPRGMTFSGKGLVRNPANPNSVILSSDLKPFPAKAQILSVLGYVETTRADVPKEESEMAEDALKAQAESLKKQVDELSRENKELKEREAKAAQESAQAVLKQAEEAKAKVAALEGEVKALKQAGEALSQAAAEAEGRAKTAENALAEIRAKAKREERAAIAREKMGQDVETSLKTADNLAALSDEAFLAHAEAVASTLSKAKQTPAPLPPKGTPAPLPPQSTNLPAPAKGASAADLDGAEPELELALGSVEEAPSEEVSKVFAQINAYISSQR